jgi:hypothetical protein
MDRIAFEIVSVIVILAILATVLTLRHFFGPKRVLPAPVAKGTKDDPWELTTAPGDSKYTMYVEGEELVCVVGSTTLAYYARAIDDLNDWLSEQPDWVPLGAVGEEETAPAGSVEAWARSESNYIGGWYGPRKGSRGWFGRYLPPLLEHLRLAELTHERSNNRVRAA